MTRRLRSTRLGAFALSLFIAYDSAHAQCREWADGFGIPGLDDDAFAWADFDDGSGAALYASGPFTAADGVIVNHVAKWEGTHWTGLGAGTNASVSSLTVFDDGSGPALYAAGSFTIAGGVAANRIAKWDGAAWHSLGTGLSGPASDMAVFDSGTGPALYVTGSFLSAGGFNAVNIARWNGASWSGLGSGLNGPGYALCVHDDGSGPALFVGGSFFQVGGGILARQIAKWNGTTWSAVGRTGVLNQSVGSLAVFDDGSGAALYAAGVFQSLGGVAASNIAKWDGSSWSALGSGVSGSSGGGVSSLAVFDAGSGAALYAGGGFTSAGGNPGRALARWDGSMWSIFDVGQYASSIIAFDDGSGSALYVSGELEGGVRATKWSESSSEPLEGNSGDGLGGGGVTTATFDDGTGSALYVGGYFSRIGDVPADSIAKWNGSSWSGVGGGVDNAGDGWILSLAVFDDGGGQALYAGGNFTSIGGVNATNIAKWDGASWSPLGSGLGGHVYGLLAFDDGSGPALYAGGHFTQAGGAPANRVAKWDGATWSALGSGLNNHVWVITVFDDGSGPALYTGGDFTGRVARWDGSNWLMLSGGTLSVSTVVCLAGFDGGSGPNLYAGGTGTACISKWNGAAWSGVGGGVAVPPGQGAASVSALRVFDDGSGPRLYVGGTFKTAGSVTTNNIARWDGASWSALSGGTNSGVSELGVFDDGADGAPDLYVLGGFTRAGGKPAEGIARWHGCGPGTSYCFGDGIDSVVTTDCPCGNFGEPGHGCANSNPTLGGARLWATGTTSPNTLVFSCEGMPNNSLATFWRGTVNVAGGLIYEDGIQCAAGTVIRFGQQVVGQGGNAPYSAASPAVALAPGATRYYQVHYRNPNPGFCPPGVVNFSNGYIVTW